MRTLQDEGFEEKSSKADVRCVGETERAIKVAVGDDVWIPKSALHDDSEVYQMNDFGRLVVLPWFAKTMGWELD